MNRFFGFLFFILLTPFWAFSQTMVINEFMSSNNNTLEDMDGDFSDWIEIYNDSDESINLLNYGISDDTDEIRKWIFPSMEILPHQYYVLFASGKNILTGNELHTNFKIKQSGEDLILSDENGETIQLIGPHALGTDLSYACIPDGSAETMFVAPPSPGISNQELPGVFASHPSAYYPHDIELSLMSSHPDYDIYYTRNGGLPDLNSSLYQEPLILGPSSDLPDHFCLIPTTPLDGSWALADYKWQEPENVEKAHVIRFAAFEDGIQLTPVSSKTYFIDESVGDRYSFPVFSLVTDSLNLFQYDTGIYIPGQNYDELGWESWWYHGNFEERGREWERAVHMSFFKEDGDLIFESDAGMRMRGFGSSMFPQKSFGLYMRSDYGQSKMEYPIFTDSEVDTYKRLVLRNSGNDFLQTHFRDALLTELLKPLDLELQNFRPSIVFINGEYWGIHGLREKYDDHYFKYHFGIEEDNINILGYNLSIEEGTRADYPEIIQFVDANDMSTAGSYAYIDARVDISNMIDFLVAEIYYANYDWPCNNYKKWRTNEEGSKWRFLIYDLDLSFGLHETCAWDKPSLIHAFTDGDSWPNCGSSNLVFRKMMENERYVNEFLNRFKFHLKYTFNADTIVNKIDYFTQLYEPEIEEHIDRWSYPSDLNTWYSEIDKMMEFAINRPDFMIEHIMEYFQLDEFDINDLSDSTFEYSPLDFVISPNPNNIGILKIENLVISKVMFHVNIINSSGVIVYTGLLQDRKNVVDLSAFANGFYIVKIFNSNSVYQHKLIISN